jgi:tRNA threonylcarbamoyladenosine biosynthesis protein TsaB
MLVLVMDVCTDRGVVSLIEDGEVRFFAGLPFGLHNSRYLVPKVEEGLKTLQRDSGDVDLIVVGIGPGSYTGMRVGAVVAKSLSYAHKTPLVGICSLEGFTPDYNCSFAAMIDAKMAGCYLLKGVKNEEGIRYTSVPEVWHLDHLADQLEDVEVIVSPQIGVLKEKLERQYPDRKWEWQESSSDVLHLSQRAVKKYQNHEYSTDGSVDLLYMR